MNVMENVSSTHITWFTLSYLKNDHLGIYRKNINKYLTQNGHVGHVNFFVNVTVDIYSGGQPSHKVSPKFVELDQLIINIVNVSYEP